MSGPNPTRELETAAPWTTARRAERQPVRVRLATAAAVVFVAATAAAVTYALWGASTSVAAGVIGNGNLDVVLVGTATWTETSPDVAPPHAFGMQADGETADHLATPGDSFTLTQQFQTVLDGDNLAARVTVRWEDPPDLDPAGQVTATYVVTRPDGVSSASIPLGTAVTVPLAPDNLTPAEVALWAGAPWTYTVTLAYTGTDVLVTPAQIGTGPVTELGTVAIDLDQVRDGTGFAP